MRPVKFTITKEDVKKAGEGYCSQTCLGATAIKRQFEGFNSFGVSAFACYDTDGNLEFYIIDAKTTRIIDCYMEEGKAATLRKFKFPHVGTFK